VGWYYAIPQVGAVLFAAGWWSALCDGVSRAGGKLTVRGALGVVLLVLVLCGIQGDRAERLHIEAAPPLAPSESGMFWSAYMRNARAAYLNAESSEHLRRTLARLDRAEQIALREGIGDTLRGLKPCSFSELLPSNMPGVPRTTWRKPGYLRGLGPLPTALGTLQPATRLGGAVAYGDVCDSSNFSIMVDVLRGDLLPTTANIELPKSQLHRTRGQLSFKDRSQRSSLV